MFSRKQNSNKKNLMNYKFFSTISFFKNISNLNKILNHLLFTYFSLRLNTCELAFIIIKDLFHISVQHVSTAIKSTQPWEALSKAWKPPHGVDERRVTKPSDGSHIKFNFVNSFKRWEFQKVVLSIHRHRMTNKVCGISLQTEFLYYVLERGIVVIAWLY